MVSFGFGFTWLKHGLTAGSWDSAVNLQVPKNALIELNFLPLEKHVSASKFVCADSAEIGHRPPRFEFSRSHKIRHTNIHTHTHTNKHTLTHTL